MTVDISRRAFTACMGAMVATFALAPSSALAQATANALPLSLRTQRALDGWIRVESDGTVTVFTGKAELGQGILTALAQIAADEMDVSMAQVRMVSADTTRSPNEGYTYGSQSVEQSGSALRMAGAEARQRLVALAAERFGVAVDTLTVRDGVVFAADGRQVNYSALVVGRTDLLARDVTGFVKPKQPMDHRLVGRSVARLDLPPKVRGGAAFIQDMRIPEMLFGRMVRPRRYGARLLAVDEARARQLPGVVTVVRNGSFLGVIAAREEQAIKAAAALAEVAHWSEDGEMLPDPARLSETLKTLPVERSVVGQAGQDSLAPTGAAQLESSYSRPYLSQGSLAPSCGVAWWRGDRMTVWSHTQGTFPLRGDIAKVLGLQASEVDVIHTPSAGCYGHNGADDAALDAALLARAVPGRAVKVQWMREDEFSLAPFGPAMTSRVRATLSAEGRIVDWVYEVWSNSHAMRPGQPGGVNLLGAWQLAKPFVQSPPLRIPQPYGDGDRNAVPAYALPRFQAINNLIMATPVRNGSLRTLGAHLNVFATESFIDELAQTAKVDPAEFRLRHLTDPRSRAVIEAVVAKAGWKANQPGDGSRGRGIAFSRYKNIGAYTAVVIDLEIDRTSGNVSVTKAVAAVDVGQIINPDGLINQIEGGLVQAIGWSLKEEVLFDRREILTRDWSSYPIMKFSDVPTVEVILLNRPTEPSLGGGEVSSGPTSAAVANAFANATGRRLRDLPFTPAKVMAVMAA